MTEILQHIAAFFDILSTRNVLIEIGAVGLCLLAGGVVGAELRNRHCLRIGINLITFGKKVIASSSSPVSLSKR